MADGHPVLIYASLAISVLLVISQAAPKILGPLGTAIGDWSRKQREMRISSEKADLLDVQRQVEYLTEQRVLDREEHEKEREADARQYQALKDDFADYRRMWADREERWAAEWRVHRRWDYDVMEALIGREPPFDPSPPFMTPDPPKEKSNGY